MARVLVACEESQAVTKAFREVGHEAYSCDLKPCTGGKPEWHIRGDVLAVLDRPWDLIIAFPPCTHLAVSGSRWFPNKARDGRQFEALRFFMRFVECKCKRVAIENPIGIMSTYYRKPDQIIHPYQFGDAYEKATCLWLRRLPRLRSTSRLDLKGKIHKFEVGGKMMSTWYYATSCVGHKKRATVRSKTPKGLAKAMAEQWGAVLTRQELKGEEHVQNAVL